MLNAIDSVAAPASASTCRHFGHWVVADLVELRLHCIAVSDKFFLILTAARGDRHTTRMLAIKLGCCECYWPSCWICVATEPQCNAKREKLTVCSSFSLSIAWLENCERKSWGIAFESMLEQRSVNDPHLLWFFCACMHFNALRAMCVENTSNTFGMLTFCNRSRALNEKYALFLGYFRIHKSCGLNWCTELIFNS